MEYILDKVSFYRLYTGPFVNSTDRVISRPLSINLYCLYKMGRRQTFFSDHSLYVVYKSEGMYCVVNAHSKHSVIVRRKSQIVKNILSHYDS